MNIVKKIQAVRAYRQFKKECNIGLELLGLELDSIRNK